MDLISLRKISLALLPATLLISGCKDDSTRAEWTTKLSVGPYAAAPDFGAGSAASAQRIDVLADGFHVVSGGSFGTDFDSTRLGTKGQVVSTQGTVNDQDQILQTTGSGLVISDCCEGLSRTVTARSKDGSVVWTRNITPGMTVDSAKPTTDFVHALVEDDGYTIQQVVLTGLDANGGVRWQRPLVAGGTTEQWAFSHDDAGNLCYTGLADNKGFLACVANDGNDTFRRATEMAGVSKLAVASTRIAVAGVEDSLALAVFNRTGSLVKSQTIAVPEGTEIHQLLIGNDQRVHASTVRFDMSAADDNLKVEVLSVGATGALSRTEIPGISYLPGPATTPGLMTTDKSGNVYVSGSQSGEGATKNTTFRTLRPMVYRIDTANVLKPVVQGRKVAYFFYNEATGNCTKCDRIPDLQVFSSLKALDDGTLLVGWSNAEWSTLGLDFGDVASVVTAKDFSLSKIPAKNFLR